jgi:pyrroloquinoline quinone biosynthesis protein B
MVKMHDYLFLDGTFYSAGELPGRRMAEVPHPLVQESISIFKDLPETDRKKIWFIHINHTNPVLDKTSREYAEIKQKGFGVAEEGLKIILH